MEVGDIRKKQLINLAAALAVFVLLQVLINHFYLHIPVTLAGERLRVSRDITISDLLREKGLQLVPGNLIDVRRKVLREGKGNPPYVLVDGKRMAFGAVVASGDEIDPHNGSDVPEPIITRKVSVSPPDKIIGEGRYLAVNAPGEPGVRLDHLGAISEIVTKREWIKKPVATVLLRTNEPPPKMIALTFDDGPWDRQTLKFIAMLEKYNATATFFVTGQQAERNPAILRRIVAAGFSVANHSYDHSNLTRLGRKDLYNQLQWTQRIVMRIARRKPVWMRPPGGNENPEVRAVAKGLGLHPVLWDLDSHDWSKPGAKSIAQTVLTEARPGFIVLMHDGGGDRSQTLAALPYIIRGLRAKGYSLVTLDDMFNISPSESRLPVKAPAKTPKTETSSSPQKR